MPQQFRRRDDDGVGVDEGLGPKREIGLLGILAAAVLAASMSTLSSAFNSMATASVVDFYQRYFRTDASDAHYLAATRWMTLFWGAIIIVPAILYANSSGSILERE